MQKPNKENLLTQGEYNPGSENNDLEKIRFYRATWKNFFDYWKARGVKTDPYEGTEMEYPTKKVQDKPTLPYQDFGTYDKSSKNQKLSESFDDFQKEEDNSIDE